MIRLEKDPELINDIANRAEIRPFIALNGSDALDFTPAVGRCTQTGVVWLSNGEDAVAAFEMTGDRDYQAHLMYADTCRGRKALDVGAAMLDFMKPWADLVWGAIPKDNRKAVVFGKMLGFIEVPPVEEYEGHVVLAKGLN